MATTSGEGLRALHEWGPSRGQEAANQQQRLDSGFDSLIGRSDAMREVIRSAKAAALTNTPVLLTGESGTGKATIARAIHLQSPRSAGLFTTIYCPAMRDSSVVRELFGEDEARGFRHTGSIERTGSGTVLLEEITVLPLPAQARLARLLRDGSYERIGKDRPHSADVRIIATSTRDLAGAVARGRLLEELYERLQVVRLHLPPLRARRADILPLAARFLRTGSGQLATTGESLGPAVEQRLLDHPWPGNVRELERTIHEAASSGDWPVVLRERLELRAATIEPPRPVDLPGATLADIERQAILTTLHAVQGSTKRAAKILDVSQRTIQYRLRAYGLSTKRVVSAVGQDPGDIVVTNMEMDRS